MKIMGGLLLACMAGMLGACATGTGSHRQADLAAIAAFNQQYLKAINDGDIQALSSLTNEDHLMLAPNRPPLAGREANDNAMRRAFEQFKIEESWSPEETVIDGDLGYQRGTFTVVATPRKGGASSTTRGQFLRIYRRQPDGSWRMTRDMFNSDQPPRPAGGQGGS